MNAEKNKKRPSGVRIYIEYWLFLLPVGLVRAVSLKNAYRLAGIVAFLFYHLDFKHRKRVVRHLLHSGIVTDKESAVCLAKKNFTHMVKVFVEIIKFDQIVTRENYMEYMTFGSKYPENLSLIDPATSIPVILASMHIGNWELSANCYSLITGQKICSIMRPLTNYKIGNYFYGKRKSMTHETVSKEKGLKPLLLAVREKKTVAIVADQHANHTEGVEVKFFGHPARAHMTPALLHLKTGIPLVPEVFVRADDEFHFRMIGGRPIVYKPTGDKAADIKAVTQAYTDAFEELVREYPDQWLWAHRRWLDCGRSRPSGHCNMENQTQGERNG